MNFFNNRVYDETDASYNMTFPTYIDGSGNNNISINGTKNYNGKFGNLMACMVVDGGDSFLGGNCIVSGHMSVYDKLHLGGSNTDVSSTLNSLQLQVLEKQEKGDTGEQGIQGVKGDTGAQGGQGVKGDTGAQGGQGVKGDTGAQGGQGVKGDTGAQGVQGSSGAGTTGSTGQTGANGAQGIQGVKGDTGAQGNTGNTGGSGATGAQGTQGVKGDTGAQGVQGSSGAAQLTANNTWTGNNIFTGAIVSKNHILTIHNGGGDINPTYDAFSISQFVLYYNTNGDGSSVMNLPNSDLFGPGQEFVFYNSSPNKVLVKGVSSLNGALNTYTIGAYASLILNTDGNYYYCIFGANNPMYSTSITATGDISTTGAISANGGISAGGNVSFNGSLKTGNYTITPQIFGFLSGATSSVQAQLNVLQSYQTGQSIQTTVYGFGKGNSLITPVIYASNNQTATVFQCPFRTKASGSTVYITFDALWSINGSGLDNWATSITYTNTDGTVSPSGRQTIAAKTSKFSQDNRQTSITIFPISGCFYNSTPSEFLIEILAGAPSSDDALSVGNTWVMTLQEIKS